MSNTTLLVLWWFVLGAFTTGAVGDSSPPPGYGKFLIVERKQKQQMPDSIRLTGSKRIEGRERIKPVQGCFVGMSKLKRIGKMCVARQ